MCDETTQWLKWLVYIIYALKTFWLYDRVVPLILNAPPITQQDSPGSHYNMQMASTLMQARNIFMKFRLNGYTRINSGNRQ